MGFNDNNRGSNNRGGNNSRGGSGGFNRGGNNSRGGSGGFNRGGSGGFRSNDGPREMHKAICSDCKQETEVPFKPSGERPVYCRECFQNHRPPKRY